MSSLDIHLSDNKSELDEKIETKYDNMVKDIQNLKLKVSEKVKSAESSLKRLSKTINSQNIHLKPRKVLKGLCGKIYALHWAPNSRDILTASQDGKLLIWNTYSTNKRVAIPLRSSWVMSCAVSPDNYQIASGGLDNTCTLFNVSPNFVGWDNKKPFLELQQHEGYISCVRFVDETQILTSSGDANIILWDIEYKQPKLQFTDHKGDVMSVAPWEHDKILSGSTDGTARIFDIRSGKEVQRFGDHNSDVNAVAWFPDGYAFATGCDDSLCRFWDSRSQTKFNVYSDDNIKSNVNDISFSKSGSLLYVAYDDDFYCVVWNTLTGESCQTLEHSARVSCLQTSPDGYSVATGCWDKLLRVWA